MTSSALARTGSPQNVAGHCAISDSLRLLEALQTKQHDLALKMQLRFL